MFKISNGVKKQKWYFLSGFLVAVVFCLVVLASFNNVLAWQEPTTAPPNGNVNPFTKTLEDVLIEDSDASTFGGDIFIGTDVTSPANLYMSGGEIEAKWLHATAAGDNNIAGNLNVAGTVKVGTVGSCTSGGDCTASGAGALCYDAANQEFLGCDGTNWVGLGGGTYL